MQDSTTVEVSKPKTAAKNLGINIGEDENKLAVDLGVNTARGSRPIQDLDQPNRKGGKESTRDFMDRLAFWNTGKKVKRSTAAKSEVKEVSTIRPAASRKLTPGIATVHFIPATLTGSGTRKEEELQQRAFPRYHQNSQRNPVDNGKVWGSHLRLHGAFVDKEGRNLRGKVESGLIAWLDGQIFGRLDNRTGVINYTGDGSNLQGVITGVEGPADGVLAPLDVSRCGEPEYIHLYLCGHDVQEKDFDWSTLAIIDCSRFSEIPAKPGSFKALYLEAEAIYLDKDNGGYRTAIQEMYEKARQKKEEVMVLARQRGWVCNLKYVVTAPLEMDKETTARIEPIFKANYAALYQLAIDAKVENPIAGPFVSFYHEKGNFSHRVAVYPEFDGRHDEEKARRVRAEPLICNISYCQFWINLRTKHRAEMNRRRRNNKRRRRINRIREWKNSRRHKLVRPKAMLPLLKVIPFRVPEVPETINGKSYMVPIVPFFPYQKRHLLFGPERKPEVSDTQEVWIEGFHLSVSVFTDDGRIEILSPPPTPSVPQLTPQEILAATAKMADKREVEKYLRGLMPVEPKLSEAVIQQLKSEMLLWPKKKEKKKRKHPTNNSSIPPPPLPAAEFRFAQRSPSPKLSLNSGPPRENRFLRVIPKRWVGETKPR